MEQSPDLLLHVGFGLLFILFNTIDPFQSTTIGQILSYFQTCGVHIRAWYVIHSTGSGLCACMVRSEINGVIFQSSEI